VVDSITTPYLDELVRGVEAWAAQGVSLAITGGRPDDSDNQPYEKEWQKHPIRSVADFERHVDEVGFDVRGIAAIHGAAFGTFSLDMDRDEGRADFDWLMANGYVTDTDLVIDSPGGHHIVYQHDQRLAEGHVRHPDGRRRFQICRRVTRALREDPRRGAAAGCARSQRQRQHDRAAAR
jgi:hypothetical protein